jgi:hypothetical protein
MSRVKVKKLAISIIAMLNAQRELCASENGNYDPIEVTITRGDIKLALDKNSKSSKLQNMWVEELAQHLLFAGMYIEYHESKVRSDLAIVVTLPRTPNHKTTFKSLKALVTLHPELSHKRRILV